MELLVGCGNNREKKVTIEKFPKEWCQLVTLDVDESVPADVYHDLNSFPYPFKDDTFDEVHAYEVLEHCGKQGDWRFFFNQFYEFWRILKPNGFFVASVPMWDSEWAWGDPGHTRVITKGSLAFLNQKEYEAQVGKTSMADYRGYWKVNFVTLGVYEGHEDNNAFAFVLQAIK